jgi:hypothetical protein
MELEATATDLIVDREPTLRLLDDVEPRSVLGAAGEFELSWRQANGPPVCQSSLNEPAWPASF